MYVCVVWQAFTDDANELKEISHSVDLSFGTLQRARLLPQTVVLRPKKTSDVNDLIVNLDGIEQAFGTLFGYAIFLHADGARFRCSDPFDVASARAITIADPI